MFERAAHDSPSEFLGCFVVVHLTGGFVGFFFSLCYLFISGDIRNSWKDSLAVEAMSQEVLSLPSNFSRGEEGLLGWLLYSHDRLTQMAVFTCLMR